jgi:hypothetical protein
MDGDGLAWAMLNVTRTNDRAHLLLLRAKKSQRATGP